MDERREIPERWREAYLHEPVVKAVLQVWQHGRTTWEQAMEELAMAQTQNAKAYREKCVELAQSQPPAPIYIPSNWAAEPAEPRDVE